MWGFVLCYILLTCTSKWQLRHLLDNLAVCSSTQKHLTHHEEPDPQPSKIKQAWTYAYFSLHDCPYSSSCCLMCIRHVSLNDNCDTCWQILLLRQAHTSTESTTKNQTHSQVNSNHHEYVLTCLLHDCGYGSSFCAMCLWHSSLDDNCDTCWHISLFRQVNTSTLRTTMNQNHSQEHANKH